MGRGQIISGGTNGQYQLKLIYAYRSRVDAKILKAQQNITAIEAQIVTVEAAILAETDPKKKADLVIQKSVLNLQIASLNKEILYYQTKMPADPTQAAWCADLTEDLTGNVGTIEIPGEPVTVLVRPGYSGRAVYSASRDGQLMPAIAGEPYQVLFNWMMLPGWQRHKPIYRAGTIAPDSLDYDANTCSVCLDAAYSSQLSLPAIDGGTVTDCEMGDDVQANYLTEAGEDFCSRNPGHPFCVGGVGAEIHLSDAMLAQLQEANAYVNGAFGRSTDQSGRAVGDRWDLMTTPGVDTGDCEDFALTKMDRLVNYHGWNPDNLKLVTAYAANGEYHAMLGIRTTNRGLVILDNNYTEVMESARVPYRLDKIALASDSWANYSRRLDNVPIEYMGCNAGAFADGDRVVVQFTGQSWTTPKVVGFLTNPQACGLDAWLIGCNASGPNDYSHMRWDQETDAWYAWGEIPGYEYGDFIIRDRLFATGSANDFYLFGGVGRITGQPAPWNYDRSDHWTVGAWVSVQAMIAARSAGYGFKIGTRHYVTSGGLFEDNWDTFTLSDPFWQKIEPTNQNWEFDPAGDSWAARVNHPVARAYSRAFTLFNLGYCFGGTTETPSNVLGQVLTPPAGFVAYNQETGAWVTKQDMMRGRNRMGVGALNGQGYVFQGEVRTSESGDLPYFDIALNGYWTRKIDKYSPTGDSWSNAGTLNLAENYSCTGVATSGNIGFGFLEAFGTWDANSDSFAATAVLSGRYSQIRDLDILRA